MQQELNQYTLLRILLHPTRINIVDTDPKMLINNFTWLTSIPDSGVNSVFDITPAENENKSPELYLRGQAGNLKPFLTQNLNRFSTQKKFIPRDAINFFKIVVQFGSNLLAKSL